MGSLVSNKRGGIMQTLALILLLLLWGEMERGIVMVSCKCTFPAVFNFGDSTSDTGGIHVAFPFITASENPPYGETYFKSPANRYSDGRLLIDFLCEALGMPFLTPYLQSVGSNFSQGANFASAGATATANTNFISPFSLNFQVSQFKIFRQQVLHILASKGYQNNLPANSRIFEQALYILEIGGNDFSYGYMSLNMTPSQLKTSIILQRIINAIEAAVKGLYGEGGRTFWIMGVGPQGCLPFFLTKFPHTNTDLDGLGCAKPFNDVVVFFNNLLRVAVKSWGSQLPGATVVYVNTYDIQYQMLQTPQKYGFKETTRVCCGVGGQYNYAYGVQCGSTATIHGQYLAALSCNDPASYINWDGVHLTDKANGVLARYILSGSAFDPQFPISSLCDLHPI